MNRLTPGRPIAPAELEAFVAESLSDFGRPAEHMLVVVPDDTRTIPMPEIFDALCTHVAPRVGRLTVLIALGTHPPMTADELSAHLGVGWNARPGVEVVQHDWQRGEVLRQVGTVEADELAELSGGLLSEDVPIRIHRLAIEADRILIVNPVFPHEVVGFSGGHKYFFPGIAGAEILDASHWLGALITNPKVNGHVETPVRALIERAAERVDTPRVGLSLVMRGHDPLGLFAGHVREAWAAAAELSAETNVRWVDRAYHTVLSIAPAMYRELWTAGKCMYKLEPVIADGGRLVIFAPHLREISPTHGELIRRVGYHTRDVFLADPERYADVPRAVLAHSTHVKGIGTFVDGIERPRVEVVLATGIPEAVCAGINLGYADPAAMDIEAYENREDEGILVVPNAGEMLYRLSDGTVPDIDRL
jgi:nickel-dependent lactate racemase